MRVCLCERAFVYEGPKHARARKGVCTRASGHNTTLTPWLLEVNHPQIHDFVAGIAPICLHSVGPHVEVPN